MEDASHVLNIGDEIDIKIVNVDRKNRTIGLSVKAKDIEEERDAVEEHRRQESERSGPGTLGDLIKAQMDEDPEDADD